MMATTEDGTAGLAIRRQPFRPSLTNYDNVRDIMAKKNPRQHNGDTESLVLRLQRGDKVPIAKHQREQVVFELVMQGWSRSAIATLLNMSERNVYRDRAAYLDRCAEHCDPAFSRRMIAQLRSEGDAVISQLLAVANRADADPATAVRALREAMSIRLALFDRLDRLNLLNDPNNHASRDDLIEEVKRIGKLAENTDTESSGVPSSH